MELLRYVTIGQYIPRDSAIHRLDPRTKLLGVAAWMVVIFLVRDFFGYVLFTLFLLALLGMAQIPLGYVFKGLRPVLFLLFLTVFLNFLFSGPSEGRVLWRLGPFVATWEGLIRGFFVGYRLVLLVVVTSLLTFTTSPVDLTDGIERLLRPFRRLGVPAHELAMMMTIALRFIPTLLAETEKIIKAQMSRGAEFQRGNLLRRAKAFIPVLVPLFLSAFRRAEELALAMEARCYRGGEQRTRMKQLSFRVGDLLALVIVVLSSVAFMIPSGVWMTFGKR